MENMRSLFQIYRTKLDTADKSNWYIKSLVEKIKIGFTDCECDSITFPEVELSNSL